MDLIIKPQFVIVIVTQYLLIPTSPQ